MHGHTYIKTEYKFRSLPLYDTVTSCMQFICVCVCWVLHIHKSSVFPSKACTSVIVKIYIQKPAINKSKLVGFYVKIDITVKQCLQWK